MSPKLISNFALTMRAVSLQEELAAAGIKSQRVTPKWANKRLPPPRTEVYVAEADAAAAAEVLARFLARFAK